MTTPLADQFTQTLREEHREIRDLLLDLVAAFQRRGSARIRDLITRTAARTGPHFRYEEEAMYPTLVEIFGPEYIDKLLANHDGAIATFSFTADQPGTYPFYCTEFCSALHLEIMGYFLVKPKNS